MTSSLGAVPSYQLTKCVALDLNCEDYLNLKVNYGENGNIHIENGQIEKKKVESQGLAQECNANNGLDAAVSTSLFNNFPLDDQIYETNQNISNSPKLIEKPDIQKSLKLVYDSSKYLENEISDDGTKSIVRYTK